MAPSLTTFQSILGYITDVILLQHSSTLAWVMYCERCRRSRSVECRAEQFGLLIMTLRMTRLYSKRQPTLLLVHSIHWARKQSRFGLRVSWITSKVQASGLHQKARTTVDTMVASICTAQRQIRSDTQTTPSERIQHCDPRGSDVVSSAPTDRHPRPTLHASGVVIRWPHYSPSQRTQVHGAWSQRPGEVTGYSHLWCLDC